MLLVVGVCLLVLGLAAAATGWWAWRGLDSNIKTTKDFEKILTRRPPEPPVKDDHRARNILILGTDTREGQKYVVGSTPGLSDTTILLHVSADRHKATAVSIPRDLIVDRPRCRSRDQSDVILPAAQNQMWNAAYALGGPACTIAQFEQMTDIRVTNYLVVRFQAVKDVAGALGGVPICMPYKIDDPIHSIYLPKGSYDAKGDVAVSYVRVRYKIGNGGDLGRLKRQQIFLASMLNKATALGTLANPVRLYSFLDAATRSVVSDPELGNLSNLIELQRELKRIGLKHVTFLTMPVGPYAPDPNRLAPGQDADLLWQDLRSDKQLHWRFLDGATTGDDVSSDGKAVPSSAPVRRDGVVVDRIRLASSPLHGKGMSDQEAEEFGLCPPS